MFDFNSQSLHGQGLPNNPPSQARGGPALTLCDDSTPVAAWQASERRCADAAATYLQRLANSSGDAGGGATLLAAPADAQLQINVLAAPRHGGGAGYLQQSVASLLYGERALLLPC